MKPSKSSVWTAVLNKANQLALGIFALFWGSSAMGCKPVDPNETVVRYGGPDVQESSSSEALSVPMQSSSSSEMVFRYGIPAPVEIANSSGGTSSETACSSNNNPASSSSSEVTVRYGSPAGGW